MIVALLAVLVLLAVGLTWVLFRDDESAAEVADPLRGHEASQRGHEQPAED